MLMPFFGVVSCIVLEIEGELLFGSSTLLLRLADKYSLFYLVACAVFCKFAPIN